MIRPATSRIPRTNVFTIPGYRISHRSPFRPFRRSNHTEFPFRPPPIRERLKPLIPFFIWWTILTSLTVHLLRIRQRSKDELGRAGAKISVLESLLERTRSGERVSNEEVRREMEMVGLRERASPISATVEGDAAAREAAGDVGWREAIFGRRKGVGGDGQPERTGDEREKPKEEDVEGWVNAMVKEASLPSSPPPASPVPRTSMPGTVRRAPSANVYL